MSTLNVDKVDPSTGTALEIGSSGDTTTIPSGATLAIASGATLANSGTATGFGLTGWAVNGGNNDLLPASASAGIYLGVSSATAANLLDDYEEGTWTPDFQGSAGSAGSSSTTGGDGNYVKIGSMVYITCKNRWSNQGSWADDVNLTGLPFTSSSDCRAAMAMGLIEYIDFKGGSSITAEVAGSATKLTFREVNDDGAPTTLVIGAFDNGSNDIILTGCYFV